MNKNLTSQAVIWLETDGNHLADPNCNPNGCKDGTTIPRPMARAIAEKFREMERAMEAAISFSVGPLAAYDSYIQEMAEILENGLACDPLLPPEP